ncbi:MAG TPA: EthD family reductase [Trebonia sp.]|nr:EthD family reductase [Trebonia sp.]
MTARFLAIYETPADPEEFDRHYREVHIPLGMRLPGLRRYTVSRDLAALRGEACYMVAELEWDTMDDLRAAFASPVGRATAADAARLQELAPVRSMVFTAEDTGAPDQATATPDP